MIVEVEQIININFSSEEEYLLIKKLMAQFCKQNKIISYSISIGNINHIEIHLRYVTNSLEDLF